MSLNDFEYTVFSGNERAKITMLDLPDQLNEWVSTNQELIIRIQDSISNTYDVLTEDLLWEIIAENLSDTWKDAKKDLNDVQNDWDNLNAPSTVPLGLIGCALDSDIMTPAAEKLSYSLANFTAINEGLKERKDLASLLQVLKVINRIVDNSTSLSKKTIKATEKLKLLDISPKGSFNKTALVKIANNNEKKLGFSLIKLFRSYARELFKPNNPEPKKANIIRIESKKKPAL